MRQPESIAELADIFESLAAPNQGLSYSASHYGERRFHQRTGEEYWTDSRPSELTIYGGRADALHALIERGKEIAAMLRATMERIEGERG